MSTDDQPRGHVTHNGYRPHTYYVRNNTHERIKAAWWGARNLDDSVPGALSTLVDELLEREAARLEAEYNGGEAFPPAPRNARGSDPSGIKRQGQHMAGLWQRRRDEEAAARRGDAEVQ